MTFSQLSWLFPIHPPLPSEMSAWPSVTSAVAPVTSGVSHRAEDTAAIASLPPLAPGKMKHPPRRLWWRFLHAAHAHSLTRCSRCSLQPCRY